MIKSLNIEVNYDSKWFDDRVRFRWCNYMHV